MRMRPGTLSAAYVSTARYMGMSELLLGRTGRSYSRWYSNTQPNVQSIFPFKEWTKLLRLETSTGPFCSLGQNKTARFSSHTKAKRVSESLSRKERRLLERKERNKAKRKAKSSNTDTSSSHSNLTGKIWRFVPKGGLSPMFGKSRQLKKIFESLVPRVPGRNISFTHYSLWMALGFRLPLLLALSFLLTDENTSPYIIQCSLGPSMLPTIQFAGDVWLIETDSLGRAWRYIFGGEQNEFNLKSVYQVGDLVIWENPENGKRSCKRIIGLEGDTIHRYGEYSNLFKHRSDLGVLWPRDEEGTVRRKFGAYSEKNAEGKSDAVFNNSDHPGKAMQSDTLVVPKQCLWLEGDCPLFSMDSRQYGPIHVSNVRGRLVFRLWPWTRSDLVNDEGNSYLSSCRISKKRPVPYSIIEPYLGNRFNFYRIPVGASEEAPK